MLWETELVILGDGSVLLECGPMRLIMHGVSNGQKRPDVCAKAANQIIRYLDEVAGNWSELKKPHRTCRQNLAGLPHIMLEAVSKIGDEDLTPMAAVAGTIADAAADLLFKENLTKVLINNGGDVAVRLAQGESVTIGLRPEITSPEITHSITFTAEAGIGGICTSGFGGRSFTRGCASAATVFAASAAIADAAATAIANSVNVESQAINRAPAETLDPASDLVGILVTTSVGELTDSEINSSLDNGLTKAEALIQQFDVLGVFLALKGRHRFLGIEEDRFKPINK